MKRVAVMCSGSGTNLQALLDAEAQGRLGARIALVVSNRKDAFALERARRAGRPAEVLSPRSFDDEASYAGALLDLLARHEVDLVCLAGYLKKIPAAVIAAYRGRMLNIHPGPLPRFGGPGMYGRRVHEAVLASGVPESGPTVHFVDEEYDRGPIAARERVPVKPGDTPETLAARVLEAEHQLYPRVVAAVASGALRQEGGRAVGRIDA